MNALIGTIIVCVMCDVSPDVKTWTDSYGYIIVEGQLAGYEDGTVLVAWRSGYMTFSIQSLCPADQQYVASKLEERSTPTWHQETLRQLWTRSRLCASDECSREQYLVRLSRKMGRIVEVLRDVAGDEFSGDDILDVPKKCGFLYEDTRLNGDTVSRTLKRLRTLRESDLVTWTRDFYAMRNTSHVRNWQFAVTICAVDEFFDDKDRYDPQRAARYRARFARLFRPGHNADDVLEQCSKALNNPRIEEVMFAVLLTDELFWNRRFDRETFDKVLASAREPAGPLRKPAEAPRRP